MNKRQRIQRARKAGKASAGITRGESSRRNGNQGGRKPNPEIQRIMAERGCSRQMASMVVRGLRQ